MLLNQRIDCAVRLMVDLACLPVNDWTTVREVAQRQGLSAPFVAKIVTQAVAAGLVTTRRGTGGGLAIAKTADSINLLEVVKIVEHPLTIAKCTFKPSRCSLSNRCVVHPILDRIQKQLEEVLAQTALSELARAQKSCGGRTELLIPVMKS